MATYVIIAQHLTLDGVDMTQWVRSCSLEMQGDAKDFTTMASGGAKENKVGLKAGTLAVEFNQDYAASTVDDRLWAIFNDGDNVIFAIRPTTAAVGVTNPSFSGQVTPTGYKPVGGAVGDNAMVPISWPTSGPVARATS